ncbi:MAG TPA: PP2C family serine/threonine-protein phosphatase [Opitutaceae bacterium]
MRLSSAALTDIGRVRRQNEDRFLRDEARAAYGVADGVGGLPGGAEAAQRALDVVAQALAAASPLAAEDLIAIAQTANTNVGALGQAMSPNVGIGTTLTFGVFRDSALFLANVGDSRCYRIRSGELTLLTEDHSVENEARQRRAKGEQVFVHEHYRNALTRCIGQPTPPEVDVQTLPIASGDLYLFVTDGVTRMLSEMDLLRVLSRPIPLQERLVEVVRWANARGGPDNSTAVLIHVEEA